MKAAKGFTLIELMITVAIIGILAAIALPSYQEFVAKSQAIEAISLLDAARTNSEDYISINGEFPANKLALIAINTKTTGTYGNITGSSDTSSNSPSGNIIFKFLANNVNEKIKEKSVWYNRTVDGNWSCQTNLSNNVAPKLCIFNVTPPIGL